MSKTIYTTADEAIKTSVQQDEITRCERTEANLAALREQCEDHVEADEHEFWGVTESGDEWRVHVAAAA